MYVPSADLVDNGVLSKDVEDSLALASREGSRSPTYAYRLLLRMQIA
jgi:hypothetical protein